MSKQVLSIEQMQHLQELGLGLKETILVWSRFMLGKTPISDWEIAYNHSAITDNSQTIPAYTLQDMLDALPKDISKDGFTWYASLYIDFENNRIAYGNTDRYGFEIYHETMIENELIDAAYSMLCWAIEQGYVETNKHE